MRSKGALHSGVYFHAALTAIRQCEGFIGRWVDGCRMMLMMMMMVIMMMVMMMVMILYVSPP